ncbi:MAG: cysteine synthase A [Alcaligenaceae bacterium]|nr:cysteine synthase A [Alcaligenaceae bacterium]
MRFNHHAETVGKTPLVRLNRLTEGLYANIYVKVEARNPAFSVKDRVGVAMIYDAIASGKLKKGMTIVEATSGNTGIALAFASAALGYDLILTMPESMSLERRKVLKGLGATLILTPASAGMKGAIEAANALVQDSPEQYIMMKQFENPANPSIHEKTTAPEIVSAMEGESIDVFVAGVGTGGTLTGVARYLKSQNMGTHIVAVEPADSPVITQYRHGESLQAGPHQIQGIGAGFIPQNLDVSLIHQVVPVSNESSIEMARLLATREGIFCGISSGAAVSAAVTLAQSPEHKGKNIVVILPDAGERYLSGVLFDHMNG